MWIALGVLVGSFVTYIAIKAYRSGRTSNVQRHSHCCEECKKKKQCQSRRG